jgi:DNA-binding NtrC family response regulator
MRNKGRVFLIDDDEYIIATLSRSLKNAGYETCGETDPKGIVTKIREWNADVVLLDVNMPQANGIDILQEIKCHFDAEVIMLTADDTAETAVKAMKLGASDYLIKPFNLEEVKIVFNNIREKQKLAREVDYLRKVSSETFRSDIVGDSGAIKEMLAKVSKMIEAGVPVILITGESGTGKEVLARHIHNRMHDPTSSGFAPLVVVNCTALPESLLEAELFGYEKGAFTDAKTDKKGLFQTAQGGTILLDEMGDMKVDLQSKLLRVLESRAIRRIGSHFEVPVDVTVVATTNRDLAEAVKKGAFRMDLFFRLNAFSLHLPPLRERTEDIPLLARHFLSEFSRKYNRHAIKGFSPQAERVMASYSWPGNVRELKNVVERLVVLESADLIKPEHLPKEMSDRSPYAGPMSDREFVLPEGGISLEDHEKSLFKQAIERAGNNKTVAAKLLNISYDSLRYHLKKYGLE